MDRVQKTALRTVWSCGMNGSDPVERMSEYLTIGEIRSRLDGLMRDGMVDGDMRVTDEGRAALTVVMCGGVFDIVHHGHIHTLAAAKRLGDVLAVVVASDKTVRKTKRVIHHDACARRRTVASVDSVDACVVGHDFDIFQSVTDIRPDVIALGYDQVHRTAAVEAGCCRLGLDTRVVRLESPVPNVSSSSLKRSVPLDVM